MRDLIQRDPREPFEEELVCRSCGEPAMTCDCDGFQTANLVANGARFLRAAGRVVRPVDAPP